MRSATLFLPSRITLLMNFCTMRFPYRGSGGTSRRTTRARRGICSSAVPAPQRALHTVRPGRNLATWPAQLERHARRRLLAGRLGRLGAVLGPALAALLDAGGV